MFRNKRKNTWGSYCGLFLSCCMAILISGCRDTVGYHVYQPTAENGIWERTDTLNYSVPAMLPAGKYEVAVSVRHTDVYPYKDLWLWIEHDMDKSTGYVGDTLHVQLADDKGRWYEGNSTGSLFTCTQKLPYTLYLPVDSMTGNFRIHHLMRTKLLSGITDVGIELRFSGGVQPKKNKK